MLYVATAYHNTGAVLWWFWVGSQQVTYHLLSSDVAEGGQDNYNTQVLSGGSGSSGLYLSLQIGSILGLFIATALAQREPEGVVPPPPDPGCKVTRMGMRSFSSQLSERYQCNPCALPDEERHRRVGVVERAERGLELSPAVLCPTCLVARHHDSTSIRSIRHSRILGRCVTGFDHDCPFLQMAVGSGNRAAFVTMLVFFVTSVALSVGPIFATLAADPRLTHCPKVHRWQWAYLSCVLNSIPAAIMVVGIGLLQTLYGAGMLASQCFLLFNDLTTSEFIEGGDDAEWSDGSSSDRKKKTSGEDATCVCILPMIALIAPLETGRRLYRVVWRAGRAMLTVCCANRKSTKMYR